jgi:hypothetical protein
VSDEPCVIGSGVLARRRVHEAKLGADRVRHALGTLPAAIRQEFDDTSPISWVRITTVEAVSDAIAAEAGADPEAWHDETVRAGATETFKTVWRVMLRLTTDEALVMRAASMYGKTRNLGKLTARIPQPGRAELTLTEFPNMRPRWARTVAIGIEVVLTLSGRANAVVTSAVQPDGASFIARWRA